MFHVEHKKKAHTNSVCVSLQLFKKSYFLTLKSCFYTAVPVA